MEENYISFRKAKVGGFNKKDVISYIEKMRNDFFDYKKAVESTIEQLNAKVRELESVCEGQKEQIREVIVEVPVEVEKNTDPIGDINAATYQLKLVADEICKNISDFMSKMAIGEQHLASTEQKPEIFDDVSAYIEETAKEIFDDTENSFEEKAESSDKVANILNSSVNFSFLCEKSVCDKKTEVNVESEKNILDCLNSFSFLG